MNAISDICDLLELYKYGQISTEKLVSQFDDIYNEYDSVKSEGLCLFMKALLMNIDELIRFPPGKDIDYFINTLKGVEGYKLSYRSIMPLKPDTLSEDEIRILDISENYCRKGCLDTEEQKYILKKQKDIRTYCGCIGDLIELLCLLCSHKKLNRYEKNYSEHCIKGSLKEKIEHIVYMFKNNGFVYCIMTYTNGILEMKQIY